jgi:hypothetical protein
MRYLLFGNVLKNDTTERQRRTHVPVAGHCRIRPPDPTTSRTRQHGRPAATRCVSTWHFSVIAGQNPPPIRDPGKLSMS